MSGRPVDPQLAEAIAEDLEAFAWLHGRELDPAAVRALQDVRFPEGLGCLPETAESVAAARRLGEAVDGLRVDPAILDAHACDFAAIYLNAQYGASPCESVWLDEDRLACQRPMFVLRELYARHGLAADNWRMRSEDHLSVQLAFLARLMRTSRGTDDERLAARFLDEHLLRWVGPFARRIAERCDTRFYAGLAELTWSYLEQLRGILESSLGEPRPSQEEIERRCAPPRAHAAAPMQFMPGAGPGW